MSNPAWMPLYIADFLRDTQHLDAAETGAYMLLIMHYWTTGSLPADDIQLARITRMAVRRWNGVRPIVQAFFYDGWKHKRIDRELATAVATRQRYASRSRQAAATRWSSNASSNAKGMLDDAPSPSPTPRKKKEESIPSTASRSKRARATPLADNWEPDEQDRAYAAAKGWNTTRIAHEAERFRDHAKANGRTQENWRAAWRNWVTSPYQGGVNAGTANQRNAPSEAADRVIARAKARESAAGFGEPELFAQQGGRDGEDADR